MTLESFRNAGLGQERLSAALLTVLAFAVARRTQEIGLRMAVGAQPGRILREILQGAMLLIGVGLAAGVGGALMLSKSIEAMLFGVTPEDPLTQVATIGVLTAIGLLAAFLPARRAARVDPMVALRDE